RTHGAPWYGVAGIYLAPRAGKGENQAKLLEAWRQRWLTSLLSHRGTSKTRHQDSIQKIGLVKRPSADARDVRFLEGWVWPESLLQQCPSYILLVLRKCRRQQLQWKPLGRCRWSSK